MERGEPVIVERRGASGRQGIKPTEALFTRLHLVSNSSFSWRLTWGWDVAQLPMSEPCCGFLGFATTI